MADITESERLIVEDFTDITTEDNFNSLPLVDLDTAKMLGDKKVAQLKHASWYDVDDEYNLIQYQGKYYRLSVIDYGGYWKYRKAKNEGLPGYVLVSATSRNGAVTQEATLVQLDKAIRYSPGAFWSYDLRRHLRGQYRSYIFDESYLEIDEEGVPYWITGVKRPTAGVFGVKTVTSFIATNAQTGESQEYSIDEAPEWIDHIFSLSYLMEVAEWHYAYVDGFWNNAFSQTNVWRTSYFFRDKRDDNDDESEAGKFANFFGYSSIVQNDQVMFYTGLTAANSAESNLGWLIIDTSSGKMVQYKFKDAKGEDASGAEESSAQGAVEQLVQAMGYEATFPLPVNIAGEPSYIMCLKGKAGLIQAYAICNIDNYSIAVQAESLDKALNLYLDRLGKEPIYDTDSTSSEPSPEIDVPEEEVRELTGKIVEVYTAEVNGTTQFYYVIGENLYRSSITLNEMQVTWKVGDELVISYYDDGAIRVVTDIKKN
ncbi:MAG: hypothetical protein K6F57_01615 [Candidatus Saccharibacteria bacterium]|nr:hypothetical protein [Candidatus Saccharibacteria bacterium]